MSISSLTQDLEVSALKVDCPDQVTELLEQSPLFFVYLFYEEHKALSLCHIERIIKLEESLLLPI